VYLVGYSTTPGGDWRGVFPIGESDGENTAKRPVGYEIGDYRSDEGWRPRKNNNCPTLAARAREDGSGQPLLKVKSATSKEVVVEPNYTYKKVNETIEQNPNEFKEGEVKALDFYNQSVRNESPCLTDPKHNNIGVFNGYRIRRLTPIECERLQGFPDNHTEYGIYDGEVKKMSNTQRYKQCGNAVTVDIVALVAEAVKPLLNRTV